MRKNAKFDPNQGFVTQRRNILTNQSSFQVQEAYKALRTNVRFSLSGKGCKKFGITSSVSGEGKSITILNLAISFAQTGQKVLLIDADMRRPSLAKLLIEKPNPGLSNYLAGLNTIHEVVRKDVYENLDVILSGEIPPNPSELLDSDNMQKLLADMELQYDYIMVDFPPVGVVADACVVANELNGLLFLVRQNVTERDAVAAGVKQLEMSGAKLLGFVINGAQHSTKNSDYTYRYSYETTEQSPSKKKKFSVKRKKQ